MVEIAERVMKMEWKRWNGAEKDAKRASFTTCYLETINPMMETTTLLASSARFLQVLYDSA